MSGRFGTVGLDGLPALAFAIDVIISLLCSLYFKNAAFSCAMLAGVAAIV